MPRVEGFPFVHRETARFNDCDAFGHVNNAIYLTYLEQARIAFLKRLGVFERPEDTSDMSMILARCEIDFRAAATVGDEIEIGVRPSRFGTKSFDLEYEIRVAGRLTAEAKTVLVAFDYERNEPMELPDGWRRSLAA
jgi:acyl-CoA thioester hydrolase